MACYTALVFGPVDKAWGPGTLQGVHRRVLIADGPGPSPTFHHGRHAGGAAPLGHPGRCSDGKNLLPGAPRNLLAAACLSSRMRRGCGFQVPLSMPRWPPIRPRACGRWRLQQGAPCSAGTDHAPAEAGPQQRLPLDISPASSPAWAPGQ